MKSKRKIRFSLLISFAFLLLFCMAVLFFSRSLLIDFLFYEEEPQKADAIILISGDNVRIKKAAELYHAGYADTVVLTTARAHGSRIEDAEAHGIPREALLTENHATSTYENALFTKEILLENEIDSAIVVTSNYHMRRTRLAFERVFRDTDVSFTYVPYHHSHITREGWQANERLFRREYTKLIGAYFLYYDGWITPIRKNLEGVI